MFYCIIKRISNTLDNITALFVIVTLIHVRLTVLSTQIEVRASKSPCLGRGFTQSELWPSITPPRHLGRLNLYYSLI